MLKQALRICERARGKEDIEYAAHLSNYAQVCLETVRDLKTVINFYGKQVMFLALANRKE